MVTAYFRCRANPHSYVSGLTLNLVLGKNERSLFYGAIIMEKKASESNRSKFQTEAQNIFS